MKLATKIYAGFMFLVVVLIALEVHQLSLIQRLHAENRKLSQISFEAMNLSLQMRSTLEPRPLEHFDNLRAQLAEVMKTSQAAMSKRIAESETRAESSRWVAWGAGPRGVLTLVTCAKARAIQHGRYHAAIGDVHAVVKPALRHRIAGNYAAQANNLTSDQLIDMLLEAVPADRTYEKPAA